MLLFLCYSIKLNTDVKEIAELGLCLKTIYIAGKCKVFAYILTAEERR